MKGEKYIIGPVHQILLNFDGQLKRWVKYYKEFFDDPAASDKVVAATNPGVNFHPVPWNLPEYTLRRMKVLKFLDQMTFHLIYLNEHCRR